MAARDVAVGRRAVAVAGRGASPAAAAWRRLVASPAARAGLIMVVAFLLVALATPLVHHYDARTDANLTARLKPPTAAHPFGTDSLGRDIFLRVLHATRV
jgi:ABC-type dipeptide/oligopeptide/nickel transport system permease subunit